MDTKITLDDLKFQINYLIDQINTFEISERKEALEFLQCCVIKNLDCSDNLPQNNKSLQEQLSYKNSNINDSSCLPNSTCNQDQKATNGTPPKEQMRGSNMKLGHRLNVSKSNQDLTKPISPRRFVGKSCRKAFINQKSNKIISLVTVSQHRNAKGLRNTHTKSRIKYYREIKYVPPRRFAKRIIIFECEHCHLKFNSQNNLSRHIKDFCEVINNSCDTENISENNFDGENYDENKYKCEICDRIFMRKQQYNMHMKDHNKYKCRDCSLTFASQKHALKHRKQTIMSEDGILREHYVEGLENLEIKCLLCPRTFQRTKKLKEHMQAHAVNSLISCSICNASYRNRHVYQNHMKSSGHDKLEKEKELDQNKMSEEEKSSKELPPESQKDKSLICDICGKEFPKRSSLVQHKKRSHSEVRYSCEICDFSSMSQSNLRRHMTSHTSERPVICEQCGTTFRNSSALKEHVLYAHQEECQHQCELCPKKFKVKSALSRHIQSCHSTERRYSCQWCKQAYKRSSHLRRHEMQRHSNLKNPQINDCIQQNEDGKVNETSELPTEHDFADKQFDHEVYMDMQWNTNVSHSESDKEQFNKLDQAGQQSLLSLMTVDAADLVEMTSKNQTIKQLVSDMNADYIQSDGMTYQSLWSDKQHMLNMDNRDGMIKYVDQETIPKSYMDKFVTSMDLNGTSHNLMYMENSGNHKLSDVSNNFVENTDVNVLHSNMNQAMHQDIQPAYSHGEGCNNMILMEHSTLQCGLGDDICKNVNNEHSDSLSVLSSLSDYIQTPFQYVENI